MKAPQLLTIACLALAAPARAGTTSFGALLHFPVPARDVGDTELGVDAGVTITQMKNAYVGLGADLIYHYWPAAPRFRAAFDGYLRSSRFAALDGSSWAFTAFQITGHLRIAPPIRRPFVPWLQVGAGAYRLNWNLDERRPDDTYAWIIGPGQGNISIVPGGYVGIGFDLYSSSAVVLGLDGAFHHLMSRQKALYGRNDLPDFSAVTVGTHVLFGRR